MLFIWYFGERYCKLCNDFDDMKNNISLILYVIQLSDRVYNVTFPAYALYSLRLRLREYRS
jgi:hypothetical protein